MAWAPSTNFEDDFVEVQSNLNLVHGQLAYEAERKKNYVPRPKSTYDYLANREKLNKEVIKDNGSKSKEIRASLAMMERIQEIAGTKPLGEHATMSDWDDESTVEKEAVAMMRHFGMMSMTDGSLLPPRSELLPKGKIHVMPNGNRKFPLILDPTYFEPGKTIKKDSSKSNDNSEPSSCSHSSLYCNTTDLSKIEGSDTSSSGSTKSHLDDAEPALGNQKETC